MKTRMYMWVTSDCNLTCKWCSQKYTMAKNIGYQMPVSEVDYIVDSCIKRGIHFDIIELTGGEATLWENIEYGVKAFSRICDQVTMVTNGNNPELAKSLGLKEWIVSASQANANQLKAYEGTPNVSYNSHAHKKPPTSPIEDSLPAHCCTSVTIHGDPQTTMEYIKGKVYYCCDAFAHSEYVDLTDEVCDFEDDFMNKFKDKKYDKQICRYCLCNSKVWEKL